MILQHLPVLGRKQSLAMENFQYQNRAQGCHACCMNRQFDRKCRKPAVPTTVQCRTMSCENHEDNSQQVATDH